MNKPLFIVMSFLSFLWNVQLAIAEGDTRFQVYVPDTQQEGGLTIQKAMRLALPTLWQRVVPTQSLEKASRLRGRTSLVLQMKRNGKGVNLVFNPVQVQTYLRQYHITMMVERAHWNLNVVLDGFTGASSALAADLMDYSDAISDALGIQLDSQGRKLELRFTQVIGTDGTVQIEADISPPFSIPCLTCQSRQPVQGDLSGQLQIWLNRILRDLRDVSNARLADGGNDGSSLYITIISDASLAAQISLEQLLQQQSEVVSVIPTMIQQESRQYRVVLREADDSWVSSWFASYGMTAVKQPPSSPSQWLIE
ncbi:MAG: hypothetical protein Q9N67_05950 [Ghiorsea sp.]|nr:hypothetical protein [Ghiorsea sp.]